MTGRLAQKSRSEHRGVAKKGTFPVLVNWASSGSRCLMQGDHLADTTMKSSIVKRSVIIGGHKTSVSLEAPFWEGLRDIAEGRGMGVSSLLHAIDTGRDNANLSSAIRVYVFEYYRSLALGALPRNDGAHVSSTFVSSGTPTIR